MARGRDEEILEKISTRVKLLRIKNNISQEAFYNDTNIHIGRIESKRQLPTIATLEKICQYFNISLKDFFADW